MLCLAVGTLENLKLIQFVLRFITQLTVHLEVKIALPEDVDEAVVFETVDDGVDDGFDAEGWGSLGDEVGVEQEGLPSFLDSHLVDDQIGILPTSLPRKEAQLSGFEDEQVEVALVA